MTIKINGSNKKAERVADYKTPVMLTNMIESENRGEAQKGGVFDKTDFDKSTEYFHILPHDEPHAIRRKAMLAKYGPQLRALMTKDYRSAIVTTCIFLAQFTLAYYVRFLNWPAYLAVLWIVGATLNHTGQVMIHDLTHYTAFDSWNINRIFAILSCLPTGLPSAITFGKYHWEHHKNLGNPEYDADLPTEWEIRTFRGPLAKLFFIFMHPAFYVFRPLFTKPKAPTVWEGINWAVVLLSDFLVVKYLGWASMCYLLGSTWFSMGLHPTAAHTIAEHYEFVQGQESYNYYGFWNFLNINLGYHLEHHDFPQIPCWRLPEVQKIAPEFYKDIPAHTSYTKVILNFIFDKNIGSFSRVDTTTIKATTKKQQ